MTIHKSVLLKEVIDNLHINPSGIYVDLTGGGGGHSFAILEKLNKNGKLFIFDQDIKAVLFLKEKFKKYQNVEVIHCNFVNFDNELHARNILQVDGIIADLGLSSDQLSDDSRGFSYMNENSNLDMRMDTSSNTLTGLDIINTFPVDKLNFIFKTYGECNNSWKIANEIVKNRPFVSATKLINICDSLKKGSGHSAKKIYQALRIYINDELEVLKKTLTKTLPFLKINGRLLIITFHSLEDRIVKHFFSDLTKVVIDKRMPIATETKKDFCLINNKAIKPSNEELFNNSRAKSALLRGIVKISS